MKKKYKFFHRSLMEQSGSMLIELLMTVALAAIIMPFIFRYQQSVVQRAENMVITEQMSEIQTALERYILDNRENLLNTVGQNITRVNIADLEQYGLSSDLAADVDKQYQLRILKSNDLDGRSTLQGVIVFSSDDITPLRTREIVAMGGDTMGFIEGNRAYGTFGAWHTDTIDLGVNVTGGIVETTSVNTDNSLYLYRVPTDKESDATMLSGLNLGSHDITNAAFFNSSSADFSETLTLGATVAKDVIFQNRTTLDNNMEIRNATVSGILSADSRAMEVSKVFSMADTGKFTSFTTGDLWVNNMTLGGLSIYADEDGPAVLSINKSLDMTGGTIDAMFVTVGFAGSITPRLVVYDRIEDSVNPNYYWDVTYGVANLKDLSLQDLNRMAPMAVYEENSTTTEAGRIFSSVSSNKNATASDYMNAINEIQKAVRAKYRRLNLE